MTTMRTEGYDPDPAINNGQGGLYVNWIHGTHPLVANIGSNYQPDPPGTHRHDPLTELRYLDDLWAQRSVHPDDAATAAEIARYTPIVEMEYASPRDSRGWLYDELIDLAHLSGDDSYRRSAQALASYIDTTLYHADVGAIFTQNSTYPSGYYRTDLAVDSGSALVEAGTDFNRPDWTADGMRALNFIFAHAFLSRFGTVLMAMTDVVGPGGVVNPQETVLRQHYRSETIDGGVARLGEIGQMALSLLHAARTSGNLSLVARAQQLLDPLTRENNELQLWDSVNGGYFAGVDFPGTTVADPGEPRVENTYKEAGRQPLVLEAFHVADSFPDVHEAYQDMEQSFGSVVVNRIFFPPGQGVLYETTPDFMPVHPSWTWVTSEAMDITVQALVSNERPVPW
jgi:hypothetical protein